MARDASKHYVVTGPYVTMTTMTSEGLRVMGYGAGAAVPPITDEQFDHLLAHGLIAAVGDEPVFAVGATPTQVAQQARDEAAAARIALAEAQARLANAEAAAEAADASARDERDRAAARQADQAAAAERSAARAAGEEPPAPAKAARTSGKAAAAKE